MARVFRASTIDLEPGMLIVWGGKDSFNGTSGVRAGYIDKVKENGSVRVQVELMSSYVKGTPDFHTIQKDALMKALVIML